MKVAIIILPVFLLISLVKCLKWYIATLSLSTYIEKNGYKPPSEKDRKECTQFVIENLVKDMRRNSF